MFLHLVDEGDKEMKTRPKRARLHADLIAKGHRASTAIGLPNHRRSSVMN